MELLGPGISDSIEIGMHWDIVGDNDGIYDKNGRYVTYVYGYFM